MLSVPCVNGHLPCKLVRLLSQLRECRVLWVLEMLLPIQQESSWERDQTVREARSGEPHREKANREDPKSTKQTQLR